MVFFLPPPPPGHTYISFIIFSLYFHLPRILCYLKSHNTVYFPPPPSPFISPFLFFFFSFPVPLSPFTYHTVALISVRDDENLEEIKSFSHHTYSLGTVIQVIDNTR